MSSHPSSNINDPRRRPLNAEQETLLPGLLYAGVAGIGGYVLVNQARSMPVKVLTPLALAAITGSYFLPAHTARIKDTWMPMRVASSSTPPTTSPYIRDVKRSAQESSLDLGHKTKETVDDVQRQAQANWDDIKHKGESLANTYRDAGHEQVNKFVDRSVNDAQFWLDRQKTEADKFLHNTASTLTGKSTEGMSQHDKEKAYYKETLPEHPSSSRWSWWKSSDSTAPKKDIERKAELQNQETKNAALGADTLLTTTSASATKPRIVPVDKSVASTAIKYHDDAVTRGVRLGADHGDRALKVHENVVDASKPVDSQGRNEKHPVEISRLASKSDYNDGKFEVKVVPGEEVPKRARRNSMKKSTDHGLNNLEKRAHMIYDGVEHLEHSIDKRIQKALQEEADFWHEQSLKEEANARGRERGM
ncbi:hypothetical protein EDD11_009231 [Mortierella claussenii]|nr:hypothetical protein EDD11_009231 [Mortierella claussenii]